jgi:regulator of cell morphogenesis and NO signaling
MPPVSTATTVAELVVDRPSRARLFEELGLDYCCGGKRSLGAACEARGLDAETVVALLNADVGASTGAPTDWSQAPLGDLCDHIVDTHHAFLRRELPRLTTLWEKVEHAHGAESPAAHDVRTTFEQLRAELERHTDEEEQAFFPRLRNQDGRLADEALALEVAALEFEHESAGALLARLGELTGGYDTAHALCNTHRAAIDGLHDLEQDLHEHIHEENNILFPRVLAALG